MTDSPVRGDAKTTNTAYIGIGSNLEQPVEQVLRARRALAGLPRTRLVGFSALYRNPAVGPGEQPDYVNAVAAIETKLEPRALLEALQAIEAAQGRVRNGVRWQPRTLDLDVLLYAERVIREEGLTVPHPHIQERAFVLRPLADLAPELVIPGLGPVTRLLAHVSQADLLRLESHEAAS